VSIDEKQLLKGFRQLSAEGQASLLDYQEFLITRYPVSQDPVPAPESIPRPANESVIGAMKRLKRTYPMLNTDDLFHRASGLVTEHMMNGREALDVIDDLEKLFATHYRKMTENCQNSPGVEE